MIEGEGDFPLGPLGLQYPLLQDWLIDAEIAIVRGERDKEGVPLFDSSPDDAFGFHRATRNQPRPREVDRSYR